jgi:DNA-binding Lrp family transcriptional regulator
VPIPDIARAAGVSAKTVARDIQTMISNGYFGSGAYFDYELNSLVLKPEAAKEARQTARTTNTAQNSSPVTVATPDNPYVAIILELRELKLSIVDIPISNKIEHIEEVTAKIFRIIEEKPEKQPQIRRFINYYLPTTLKLLHSYATLEKQGIKGENITSAKENIGRILDTLATGFEQQLDQLFKSDAIDIAADITVLESLMQQDGLTGDKPEFRVMESSS